MSYESTMPKGAAIGAIIGLIGLPTLVVYLMGSSDGLVFLLGLPVILFMGLVAGALCGALAGMMLVVVRHARSNR